MQNSNLGEFSRRLVAFDRKSRSGTAWWGLLICIKTAQNNFQHLDFDMSLEPVFITWCCNHGTKKLPHFRDTRLPLQQYDLLKTRLITALGAYNLKTARWFFCDQVLTSMIRRTEVLVNYKKTATQCVHVSSAILTRCVGEGMERTHKYSISAGLSTPIICEGNWSARGLLS